MEVYFRNCQALCLQIISATEIGLNVPPGVLVNRCLHDASELRFNYYPSSSVKSLSTGTSKRSWPHTDFGIITLLFQDAVGGLELEDRRNPGSFVPVVSSSSGSLTELIVNTADCLTRWTNNVIRAGLHQVNLPVHMKQMKDGTVPDRYTCPFFLKAGYGTSVGPVPAFISQKQLAAYDEITAIEYHKQRIMVVYEGVPTTEVGASGASPNGSSADGVSGVKPNAFSANGIHSERVEAYGVEVNGLKVDGVEANGVKANEIEAN